MITGNEESKTLNLQSTSDPDSKLRIGQTLNYRKNSRNTDDERY
jgi:hypothetical protein